MRRSCLLLGVLLGYMVIITAVTTSVIADSVISDVDGTVPGNVYNQDLCQLSLVLSAWLSHDSPANAAAPLLIVPLCCG